MASKGFGRALSVTFCILIVSLFLGGIATVGFASSAHRIFSSYLAVSIPIKDAGFRQGNPTGLSFESDWTPYQGFGEVFVVDGNGYFSAVGASPVYNRNGSIEGYGAETSLSKVQIDQASDKVIHDPETNMFYVINNGENRVFEILGPGIRSNGTLQISAELIGKVTPGTGPIDECYIPSPFSTSGVYVLNWLSGSIGVINTTTNLVSRNLTVPSQAFGSSAIACDTWNGSIFLSGSNGLLLRLNATSDKIVNSTRIASADGAITGLTFDRQNGLLYAVNTENRAITIVDSLTFRVVDNLTLAMRPWALATDSSDNIVFASAGNKTIVLDGNTNQVIGNFSITPGTFGFAVDPYNRILYVGYETGTVDAYAFSLGMAPQTVTTTTTFIGSRTLVQTSTFTAIQPTTLTRSGNTTTTFTASSIQGGGLVESGVVVILLAVVVLESGYIAYAARKRPL